MTTPASIPEQGRSIHRDCVSCLTATRRDPGTQSYEWYLNANRTECLVLEVYQDSNALLAHVGNLGDLLGRLMTVSDLAIEVCGDPLAGTARDWARRLVQSSMRIRRGWPERKCSGGTKHPTPRARQTYSE